MFYFGDIVVVNNNYTGVVVNGRNVTNGNKTSEYDVYVREYSSIKTYNESQINRYKTPTSIKCIVYPDTKNYSACDNDFVKKKIIAISGEPKDIIQENTDTFNEEIAPILLNYKNSDDTLTLSAYVRARNCLARGGIFTKENLLSSTPEELKQVKNMGSVTYKYIVNAILLYYKINKLKPKYSYSDYIKECK